MLGYKDEDVSKLASRISEGNLKLDEDEKEYSLFLSGILAELKDPDYSHVESIHYDEATVNLKLIPANFRSSMIRILLEYTEGFSELRGQSWIRIEDSSRIIP